MNDIAAPENDSEEAVGCSALLATLKIRSLIADKEMITAQANYETQRFGEWRMDYPGWHDQIDKEIEALFLVANSTL